MNKSLFALLAAVPMVFASCGTSSVTHGAKTEWNHNESGHWHDCKVEGCTVHKYDFSDHAWNDGVVSVEPTCHSKGERTFTCTICEQIKVEEIPTTNHNFETTWSKNETHHWHKCLNEGCTEIDGKAAHTYGEVHVVKEATCTEAGSGYKECECGNKVDVTINPTGHINMRAVEETIPTHEKAGMLAHYFCDDCKGYFKDESGLLSIDDPSTLEITSPVIKKSLVYTNLGSFDTVDQKGGTGEKHKDGSGGYAAWFNINDEQGKGAVYVEANLKLTKNAQYADFGFIIGTTGKTAMDRVVRASLYVPSATDNTASHARIRTEYEDAGAAKDKEEKRTALPTSINVKDDFVKLGMYRKGTNVTFFVNDEIATGMNMNWQSWAKAADETVSYEYGIFGQNISDIYYSDATFEYGDVATALYENLAMNKIMPDTRTGSYGAYKFARGNKVWNEGNKTSVEAPFLTSDAQKLENTYVEGMFKAKANANDAYASFGFMMTLANGTNNKGNIVVRPVLYVHNGDANISGLKIKQIDKSNNNADVDKFTKGGVLSYGNLVEGVKFAMYRAGTTIKLYINNQEVFSQTDGWEGSALSLADAQQKMVYSIWQQNMTDTEASNLNILTGSEADAAVADLKTTGELDMATKFGQYSVSNSFYNGGVVSVNKAKTGVFDRRIIKSSVYFESSFKFSSMKAWSQVGIEFVQTHSKDGSTTYEGTNAERLSVGLKHNANNTEGTFTRLVAKANPISGTAGSDQTIKDALGFASDTEVKLGVYRSNEKVYAVINDTDVYEISSSIYSSVWTDFSDSDVGYNLGVYYDGSTDPTGSFSKISMITGSVADAKIENLLQK